MNQFYVWTSQQTGDQEYCDWTEDLTIHIKKDDINISLTGEEMQEIINVLPRTFSGAYRKRST